MMALDRCAGLYPRVVGERQAIVDIATIIYMILI